MLKQFLYTLFVFVLVAGCARHSDPNLQADAQQPKGGLFFLADSLQGERVREDPRFNKKGYAFIQEDPILSLGDVELSFFYDQVVAADTFALLAFELSEPALQQWQAQTADADRKKVGLVVDEELIHWFPLNNAAYPALQFCYCEYSRDEIEALEKRLRSQRSY